MDMNNDMHNYILPQVPILRKKWSKPVKLVLPIILDTNSDSDDSYCIHKSKYKHNCAYNYKHNTITISKWRVKTHKCVTIQYIKRSKKIVNKYN